jgi:arginine decarboxylase
MPNIAKSKNARADRLRGWSIQDSLDLYKVRQWGAGFFGINQNGHVVVTPRGADGPSLDLKSLVDELSQRGIDAPMLIRFSDVIQSRIRQMNEAFIRAFADHEYKGAYMGVYPIKVNQQRHVVEEIIRYGREYRFGLEAGSKPELLAVLAMLESTEALIICNGYKDTEYIEMALWGTKLGKKVVIVVEQFGELERIIDRAQSMGVSPNIGFRMKLTARGSGRWQESGGSRSKFGLTVTELLRGVELLKQVDMLDRLILTHFHLGSQVTNIRSIKEALAEACRIYLELSKLGAGLEYFDVGGGMAVDYDGSSSNFPSSANYTLTEYTSDIVHALTEACEESSVPHPTIVTECGRALTAYQSVLICNVLSVTELAQDPVPSELPEEAHAVLHNMLEMFQTISAKNLQESYHDALHMRDEAMSLFNLGYLTLADCGIIEALFWASCRKIVRVMREVEYYSEELESLSSQLADTYVCNFSRVPVGARLPGPIGQLFPVMPRSRASTKSRGAAVPCSRTSPATATGKIDPLRLHRPARRQAHAGGARLPRQRRRLGPRATASAIFLDRARTRRSWATCTTSSATPTPCMFRSETTEAISWITSSTETASTTCFSMLSTVRTT